MATLAIEAIGWAGSALLLGAYLLTSAGRLASRSVAYQLMNVAGAACLAANVLWHRAYPAVMLELAWIAIGLVTLARHITARDRP
ncbi:MAG: CBU_0592 family membrane protein [Sphingomonas sp.]